MLSHFSWFPKELLVACHLISCSTVDYNYCDYRVSRQETTIEKVGNILYLRAAG